MTDAERDALWRCVWCHQWFVVPSLARWHEKDCDG